MAALTYSFVEHLIEDPSYVRGLQFHIEEAFRRERLQPTEQDRIDAFCELRLLLLNPYDFERWESQNESNVKQKLSRMAVFRAVGNRRLRETPLHPSHDALPGKYDPLKCKELWLWSAVASAEYRTIESPDYRIEFDREDVAYEAYRERHCFVPLFDIVPSDNCGWGRKIGAKRRYRLYEDRCTPWESDDLREQRSRYARALRQSIPSYLNWQGFQSLHPKDQIIVIYVRRNRVLKKDLPELLEMPPSTFYDCWKRLDRRGYIEAQRKDGTVELNYFPVMDHNLKPIDEESWERIRERSMGELMDGSPEFYNRVLTDEEFSIGAAVSWAQEMQLEAAKVISTDANIAEFDALQRALITTLVEKPVNSGKMTLSQVDALLKDLGNERVKQLMFRSIRTRTPIPELFTFSDVFREHKDLRTSVRFRPAGSEKNKGWRPASRTKAS